MKLAQMAKAIIGAALAGYGLFDVATSTGSPGGEGVTSNEWIRIAVTMVIAFLGVWAVPNEIPPPKVEPVAGIPPRGATPIPPTYAGQGIASGASLPARSASPPPPPPAP